MSAQNSLPIHEALPRLKEALDQHRNVVLQAPPGAGKSTGVPLALLNEPWVGQRKILMLEPRRLATRAVATRMASQLNEPVGQTIGYRTRLDNKTSRATRIEVVTEGILTRRLQHDAALEDTAMVIFDEFHERNLQADLGLALCLDVQTALRDDLKLLVMSATLDSEAIATLLDNAPIVTSTGRAFPVDTIYRSTGSRGSGVDNDTVRTVTATILRAIDAHPGDVLAFLPGQGEIRRAQRLLEEAALPRSVAILPLYGELSPAEQDAAIRASEPGRRKIVLTTNIAETSLTIEGVRIVVDCGLVRRARFDPATGMSGLDTARISRAAADQRRGRAGRLESGVCYRLWTETEHSSLAAQTPAEILDADLAPLALELASWGTSDVNSIRWLNAPPSATLAQARELLCALQALDAKGRITDHGRAMVKIAVHPRLAHMLLAARSLGLTRLASEIAALLGERDLLRFRVAKGGAKDADLRLRLDALHGDRHLPSDVEVDFGARERARRNAVTFERQTSNSAEVASTASDNDVGVLLAYAFPDRIGYARGGSGRYLLANGRGALLVDPQILGSAEFLVAAELDDTDREARIRLAAPISRDAIEKYFSAQIKETARIEWSAREAAVVTRVERTLGAIVLAERKLESPDPSAVGVAMLEGIRSLTLDALPWSSEARSLQARMEFVRRVDSGASPPWPAVSDVELIADLERWLGPWLDGITRRDHLARLDLHATLLAMLSWSQQSRLGELAPTHLPVPSGSQIPIDYASNPPTLAVRLQEVFGLTETPRVGGGRIPLLMQLLSPARRPVQTTQDLSSFWARGYHDVKKDLKGRYPKHYWPDDPLQAQATARAKPRER